ncbi:organic anion transporter 3-like isoform X1 [Clytia hemisphaerica]|uniref:Major facilitator superfamily (MFS) profile domain-containing protein n=1 Tax=Clytia hemisphaerica TaxID=252671 RepID=A0A7M5XHL8_9CNID
MDTNNAKLKAKANIDDDKEQNAHPPSSTPISYQDLVVSSIGKVGRWQFFLIFSILVPKVFIGWSIVAVTFSFGKTDWWKVTTKINPITNVSQTVRLFKDCSPLGVNDTIEWGNTNTIIYEFGLICDKAAIPTLIKTAQMVGMVIGAAVNGQLGDWFGRRKCILGSVVITSIFIFVESFSNGWQMMLACRFIVGAGIGAYQVLNLIYTLEFMGTSWRTIVGIFPYWTTGNVILGALYYVVPYWKDMYLTTGGCFLPFVILMFFTTESVRWLLIHGKTDEAIKSINKIAKFNKRPKPDVSLFEEAAKREESEMKSNAMKYNYATLFRMKPTRMKTIFFGFCWLTMGFSYYVFIFGLTLLDGSPGLNMMLTGLGSALTKFVVWIVNKKFGRRKSSIIFFVASVIFALLFTILHVAEVMVGSVLTALAIFSVLGVTCVWDSVMMFSIESYPTVIRSSAYGFVSIMSRIGGVIAAQADFIYAVAIYFPYLIVGVLCTICAIGVFQLTDTIDLALDDGFEDNEEDKGAEMK